jgi:hypothetical protein
MTRLLFAASLVAVSQAMVSSASRAADLGAWRAPAAEDCELPPPFPPPYPPPVPPQDVAFLNLPFAAQKFWASRPSRAWQIICLQHQTTPGRWRGRRVNAAEAQAVYGNHIKSIGQEPRRSQGAGQGGFGSGGGMGGGR